MIIFVVINWLTFVFLITALACLIWKMVEVVIYRLNNPDEIPFKLGWYNRGEIYASFTVRKRRKMHLMNQLSTTMWVSIILMISISWLKDLIYS